VRAEADLATGRLRCWVACAAGAPLLGEQWAPLKLPAYGTPLALVPAVCVRSDNYRRLEASEMGAKPRPAMAIPRARPRQGSVCVFVYVSVWIYGITNCRCRPPGTAGAGPPGGAREARAGSAAMAHVTWHACLLPSRRAATAHCVGPHVSQRALVHSGEPRK
jgi:hypothetical protein